MIPLVDLKAQYETIKIEIQEAVYSVLESQRFIMGDKVEELESKIAQFCNVRHGIGVASGSDALLLSLMSIGISAGDEVITTPYTFFATAGAVSRLGGVPVFVDIDRTYNIDPYMIEDKITSRTKAIIPVHLFGQCADMDIINEIAQRHGLYVIEDAAQAIGARYKGRKAGSMGDLGCLSFFPTKNLGCYGDGGMVLTDNDELAEKIRVLRVHGSNPKYHHSVIGINSRLDAIQAAVLLAKFKYLVSWNMIRRSIAMIYNNYFIKTAIKTPITEPFNDHVFNQYVIALEDRDGLRDRLKENGISSEVYYPIPLHLQECYNWLGYKREDLPESSWASEHTLALPVYPELTWTQQKYIIDTVLK